MDQDFDDDVDEGVINASNLDQQGNYSVLGKRKSFPASDGVSMKTLMRWKVTNSVCVDHLLGFCPDSTPEEHAKAEELLVKTGMLVCCLCGNQVAANKKSVKRHQTKNRKHLQAAVQMANGQIGLDVANGLNIANCMLESERRMSAADVQSIQSAKASRLAMQPDIHLTPAVKAVAAPSSLTEEAWEIITHEGKVTDQNQMTRLLQQLGVYEGKDLAYCDPKEINEISKLLKKVPQRRFQQIYGLDQHGNVAGGNTPLLMDI
jgi:hypothetical protein